MGDSTSDRTPGPDESDAGNENVGVGGKASGRKRSAQSSLSPPASPSSEFLQQQSGVLDPARQDKLLSTLEQLLAVEGTNVRTALTRSSDLIIGAVGAEKADIFLYEPSTESLVAMGTSQTPMGLRQHQIGMAFLPLANGGREAGVFETGQSYITGQADQDPEMLPGFTKALGIRSSIIVPMDVNAERRGVLQACSTQPDAFSQDDLAFMQAVSRWVGALTHRAELTERFAQEAALQARRVVAEELITVLAHDLRHQITPLKGWLGITLERARRDRRAIDIKGLESATRSVDRLEALIRDLLDVGRLDQGLFSVALLPVDLVSLVRDTAYAMGTTSVVSTSGAEGTAGTIPPGGGERIDILLRVPDERIAQVDPSRLRQALENLISNALRHSPAGAPVLVEVSSDKMHREGERGEEEWAVISVRDQGPGIADELLPRLFTRFASGPNSTGLGLGLYLARSIAEAHGGTLTVESSLGQGTTFQLRLPLDIA